MEYILLSCVLSVNFWVLQKKCFYNISRFDATILQNKINIICLFLKKINVFLPSIKIRCFKEFNPYTY